MCSLILNPPPPLTAYLFDPPWNMQIKFSGWVLLPIGLGTNVTKVDSPLREAIKDTERRIKQDEETHMGLQAELDELTKQEAGLHATLCAHDALISQLTYLSTTITDLESHAESAKGTIGSMKKLADRLIDIARDLEDKGAMTDYQVSKKEYAAHVVCVLDMALPQFTAVGEVEGVLLELEGGDDEKGTVKEALKNEIAIVRRKLELVRMLN